MARRLELAVGEAHLHDAPDPLPDSIEISDAVRTLVDDLLRKDPLERPQDATSVLDRVEFSEYMKAQPTPVASGPRAGVTFLGN